MDGTDFAAPPISLDKRIAVADFLYQLLHFFFAFYIFASGYYLLFLVLCHPAIVIDRLLVHRHAKRQANWQYTL